MVATTWYDAKLVMFLSTFQDLVKEGVMTQRWVKGEWISILTTPQQEEYQKYMRGVDLIDQMYGDYIVHFWSKK